MASWSRAFPGHPEQVSQARRFVAAVLAGRPEADEAALIVSELCTNAVRHSASGEPEGMFAVTVRRAADRSRISVQDMGSSSSPAVKLGGDVEALECGRGLQLVAALTKEWGTMKNRLGWLVWAELASVADARGVPAR